jgi:hypothetical protein
MKTLHCLVQPADHRLQSTASTLQPTHSTLIPVHDLRRHDDSEQRLGRVRRPLGGLISALILKAAKQACPVGFDGTRSLFFGSKLD